VTSSPAWRFWWSDDGSRLSYNLLDAESMWWQFDVSGGSTRRLETAPPEDTESPAGPFSDMLPSDPTPFPLALSPSSQKLAYAVWVPLEPTSSPSAEGEPSGFVSSAEDVYVLVAGELEAVRIGRVLGRIESIHWLQDDDRFVLQAAPLFPGEASMWLGTVSQRLIVPLVPASPREGLASFRAASPDSRVILYASSTGLRVKRLADGHDTTVLTANTPWAWFISPEHALLLLSENPESGTFRPYVLGITSGELEPVSSNSLSPLMTSAHAVSLSPDHTMLAFIESSTHGLSIMTLCPLGG
jgi:hypothetical protein